MKEIDKDLAILREANIIPSEALGDPWIRLLAFGFVKEAIDKADEFDNVWQKDLTKNMLKEGFIKLKEHEVTKLSREWVVERVAPHYVEFIMDPTSHECIKDTCSWYDHAIACLEVAEANFGDSAVMDRIANAFYYATRKISNEEIARFQPKPGDAF